MLRGKIDSIGWVHKDIPIANCIKCKHRVYRDEPHERSSFVDASGNNDWEVWHKNCPKHQSLVKKITVEYRCQDCGVITEDEFIGRFTK